MNRTRFSLVLVGVREREREIILEIKDNEKFKKYAFHCKNTYLFCCEVEVWSW
jgi:hypothetical protein